MDWKGDEIAEEGMRKGIEGKMSGWIGMDWNEKRNRGQDVWMDWKATLVLGRVAS